MDLDPGSGIGPHRLHVKWRALRFRERISAVTVLILSPPSAFPAPALMKAGSNLASGGEANGVPFHIPRERVQLDAYQTLAGKGEQPQITRRILIGVRGIAGKRSAFSSSCPMVAPCVHFTSSAKISSWGLVSIARRRRAAGCVGLLGVGLLRALWTKIAHEIRRATVIEDAVVKLAARAMRAGMFHHM